MDPIGLRKTQLTTMDTWIRLNCRPNFGTKQTKIRQCGDQINDEPSGDVTISDFPADP